MKRLLILAVMLLSGSTALRDNRAGEPAHQRGGLPGRTYTVISATADPALNRGGPNVWACHGTAITGSDGVELQAANDAAAVNGGKVKLIGPKFYVSKPTGAVDVDDTLALSILSDCYYDTATEAFAKSTLYSALYGITTWDHGAWTNISVGDMLRVTGGVDAIGGETLEQNYEECIATVRIKAVPAFTNGAWANATKTLTKAGAFIGLVAGDYVFVVGGTDVVQGFYYIATRTSDDAVVLKSDINGVSAVESADVQAMTAVQLSEAFDDHSNDATQDYTGVDCYKIIPAVTQSPYVLFEGTGISGARVFLANDANCALWMIKGTSTRTVYSGMENIYLYGNRQNQGDHAENTYDRRCVGLLLNDYIWDVHLRNVGMMQFKGEGVIIDNPWGLQWFGGWVEYCPGKGVQIGGNYSGNLWGLKVISVGLDAAAPNPAALFLRKGCGQIAVNSGMFRSDTWWAVYCQDSIYNRFIGCLIQATATGANGGIVFDNSTYNIVSGCDFHVTAGSSVGIDLMASSNNMISGCRFYPTCPTPIDLTGNSGTNQIVGNWGVPNTQQSQTTRLQNTSGGTINSYNVVKYNGSAGTMTPVTASTDKPVGVAFSTANGNWGTVLVKGFTIYLATDDGAAIAIGDLLSPHDTMDGHAKKAVSTNWVFAIAESVHVAGTPGNTVLIKATLVEPYRLP